MIRTSLIFVIVSCLLCPKVTFGETAVSAKKAHIVSVTASSSETKLNPENAIDGKPETRWSSEWSDPQWLTLDLGEKAVIDKVVLHWETAHAKTYEVHVSEDGKIWYVVYNTTAGKEGKQEVYFKPVAVRYVRAYCIERATQWGYSLLEIEVFSSGGKATAISEFKKFDNASVLELAKSSPKAYYTIIPQMCPDGYYPKWLTKKQNYWTLVGTKDSFNESVLCEDGTIEPFHKGFSFMPYLYLDNRLITAADCKISLSLEEGYIPVPTVIWNYKELVFKQKLFASGGYDSSATYVWYRLENTGTGNIEGKLYLTIRPFQANPPWQSGGLIDVFSIEDGADKRTIRVNDRIAVLSLTKPDNFGAIDYLRGDIIDLIKQGCLPPAKEAYDPLGAASSASEYKIALGPGKTKDLLFIIPVDKGTVPSALPEGEFFEILEANRNLWKEELNKIRIDIPEADIVNVVKSNVAYMLISKDGAALQPGSRNYKRTWMRDGAEMAVALMKTGNLKEAREYLDWVAKREVLYSGEVLPMINSNGSADDWGKTLKEYDSQGEFVYTVAEYYRFTKDKEFLREKFPAVVRALKFLEQLRQKRLTDDFKDGTLDKRRFYGILPESVSHEGYAAPGMHSYWDDFWALKGWKDAQYIAGILGEKDLIPWMKKEEQGLRDCLINSIKATQEFKNIKYIPGCADLGDFDATATSISVWQTDEFRYLPQEDLLFTLNKYYEETFLRRIKEGFKSEFTPYEIRTATAYLVLGEKEKALTMLRWFLTTIRPKEWNHWGEVVWPDYYAPKYIGDMPHSWEGAIFVNSVRNLFAYELDEKLILGAGIDEAWLSREEGVSVDNLPTHYGKIGYTVQKQGNNLKIKVWGDINQPPAVFEFRSPLKLNIKEVRLNGKGWKDFQADKVSFKQVPAEISIRY